MADQPSASQISDTTIAIIGLGSAGEAAARQLAQRGISVVGFEPNRVGGECPFTACMPSKSMLHDAHRLHAGADADTSRQAWRAAVQRRNAIVDGLDDEQHAQGLRAEGVEIVRSPARIVAPHTVEADGRQWTVDHVILATGSAPIVPDVAGLERNRIWTADEALTSDRCPPSIMIWGAGPIGCELGDVYRSFGSSVIIVDRNDSLLDDHDAEVGSLFHDLLRAKGIEFRLGTEATTVDHRGNEAHVVLDDGSSGTTDQILVAIGQAPRIEDLGLETLGVNPADGFELDDAFRVVGHDWLHVLGDVNDRSPWTHGANRQAAIAVEHITGSTRSRSDAPMPRCVFTAPTAAHVGETALDIEGRGGAAIRGTARFGDIARSSTDELGDGLVVVTVDRSTGRIVGFSGVGPRVEDIVSTATALIHADVDIETARTQVFPFPTISQVLEVALADAAAAWNDAKANG